MTVASGAKDAIEGGMSRGRAVAEVLLGLLLVPPVVAGLWVWEWLYGGRHRHDAGSTPAGGPMDGSGDR